MKPFWKWFFIGVGVFVLVFLVALPLFSMGHFSRMPMAWRESGMHMGGGRFSSGMAFFRAPFMGLLGLLGLGALIGGIVLLVRKASSKPASLVQEFPPQQPVESPAPEIPCPNCQKSLQAGWIACPYCGQKLS